ncbi:MAG TPA: hypothetical protein PKH65_08105 [Bacteroidia bacterium]|nr:hypothetical protein [Bacteroidia bacterium]HNT80629.1 hypothetical protein [Bacteroidia bacterium]
MTSTYVSGKDFIKESRYQSFRVIEIKGHRFIIHKNKLFAHAKDLVYRKFTSETMPINYSKTHIVRGKKLKIWLHYRYHHIQFEAYYYKWCIGKFYKIIKIGGAQQGFWPSHYGNDFLIYLQADWIMNSDRNEGIFRIEVFNQIKKGKKNWRIAIALHEEIRKTRKASNIRMTLDDIRENRFVLAELELKDSNDANKTFKIRHCVYPGYISTEEICHEQKPKIFIETDHEKMLSTIQIEEQNGDIIEFIGPRDDGLLTNTSLSLEQKWHYLGLIR